MRREIGPYSLATRMCSDLTASCCSCTETTLCSVKDDFRDFFACFDAAASGVSPADAASAWFCACFPRAWNLAKIFSTSLGSATSGKGS